MHLPFENTVALRQNLSAKGGQRRQSGARASLLRDACRARASTPPGWKLCTLHTSGVARYRAVFSRRSDRRRIFLFSLEPLIRESRSVAKRGFLPHQALLSEDLFHVSYLLLNRAAHFFGCATVPQVGVAARLARLFLDRPFGLFDASLYLVLRARLHATESGVAERPDGVDHRCFSMP